MRGYVWTMLQTNATELGERSYQSWAIALHIYVRIIASTFELQPISNRQYHIGNGEAYVWLPYA